MEKAENPGLITIRIASPIMAWVEIVSAGRNKATWGLLETGSSPLIIHGKGTKRPSIPFLIEFFFFSSRAVVFIR